MTVPALKVAVVGPVATSPGLKVLVVPAATVMVWKYVVVVMTVPLAAENREFQLAVQAGFLAHPPRDPDAPLPDGLYPPDIPLPVPEVATVRSRPFETSVSCGKPVTVPALMPPEGKMAVAGPLRPFVAPEGNTPLTVPLAMPLPLGGTMP